MNVTLTRNGVTKGVIYWNPQEGKLEGLPSLVEPIVAAAADAVMHGSVSGEPIPTSYPVSQPLNNVGEFAALLHSMRYSLDGELLAAFNQYRNNQNSLPPRFSFASLGIKSQVIN